MPRRNHNARIITVHADLLAASVGHLADYAAISDTKYPCAGCCKRGHWNGDYCPVCKVQIILQARNHVVAGR